MSLSTEEIQVRAEAGLPADDPSAFFIFSFNNKPVRGIPSEPNQPGLYYIPITNQTIDQVQKTIKDMEQQAESQNKVLGISCITPHKNTDGMKELIELGRYEGPFDHYTQLAVEEAIRRYGASTQISPEIIAPMPTKILEAKKMHEAALKMIPKGNVEEYLKNISTITGMKPQNAASGIEQKAIMSLLNDFKPPQKRIIDIYKCY